MEILSKKSSKSKCLSADAPVWNPSESSNPLVLKSEEFPPLGNCWEKPLTPTFLLEKNAELEKNLASVTKELMDTKADVVRLEKRSEWLETRRSDDRVKHGKMMEEMEKRFDKLWEEKRKLEIDFITSKEDREDTIKHQMSRLRVLQETLDEKMGIISDLMNKLKERSMEVTSYQDDINRLSARLREQSNDWVSHSLKIKCILDEMKKANVLPEDHAEWVYPMVEDIEIPHNSFVSNEEWIGRYLRYKFILDEVFKVGAIPADQERWIQDMLTMNVPMIANYVRRRYLPSYEDAHFEDDGDEREQAERINEWTRDALRIDLSENFVNLLIEDRPRVVSMVTCIQALIRGNQSRERYRQLYGSDPTERVLMVTFIQKMIRGYLVRGIRFRDTRNIGIFTSSPTQGNVFAMLSRPSPSMRVGIRLVNTGTRDIKICWVRSDGTLGRPTTVPSGNTTTTNISTFITHSFLVENPTGTNSSLSPTPRLLAGGTDMTESKIVRIPRFFKSGTVFDVKTGISFTLDHWNDIAERVISKEVEGPDLSVSSLPQNRQGPCQCPRCVARREMEREEEDRIQVAIMLSIQESEIRDGTFDYSDSLLDMFRDE